MHLNTALKAQMRIQHSAPAQGNSYMDHPLLDMQWSSGLVLATIQASIIGCNHGKIIILFPVGLKRKVLQHRPYKPVKLSSFLLNYI